MKDLIFQSLHCFEHVGESAPLLFGHKLVPVISSHHFPHPYHYSEVRVRAVSLIFYRKHLTQFLKLWKVWDLFPTTK